MTKRLERCAFALAQIARIHGPHSAAIFGQIEQDIARLGQTRGSLERAQLVLEAYARKKGPSRAETAEINFSNETRRSP
jgi:hypothetical protein